VWKDPSEVGGTYCIAGRSQSLAVRMPWPRCKKMTWGRCGCGWEDILVVVDVVDVDGAVVCSSRRLLVLIDKDG